MIAITAGLIILVLVILRTWFLIMLQAIQETSYESATHIKAVHGKLKGATNGQRSNR